MEFEERFTFSPRHLHLLEHLRETKEALGCTSNVEVTTMTQHKFELHTLVIQHPAKENPVAFTRAIP
jgi:hypothetical protein